MKVRGGVVGLASAKGDPLDHLDSIRRDKIRCWVGLSSAASLEGSIPRRSAIPAMGPCGLPTLLRFGFSLAQSMSRSPPGSCIAGVDSSVQG